MPSHTTRGMSSRLSGTSKQESLELEFCIAVSPCPESSLSSSSFSLSFFSSIASSSTFFLSLHPHLFLTPHVLLSYSFTSSGVHMGSIPSPLLPAQNYFLFQFPGEVVNWFLNQTSFFYLMLDSFSIMVLLYREVETNASL